jgi:UDP-N-acetylglucosamine acyltransferase
MIHSTAVIHPKAGIDPTVSVGPYAVIDEHVVVGPHCLIGPQVHLTGHTTVGGHNRFHAGCVIGDAPQDLKYKDAPTRLRIGNHNAFREHATVHRSASASEDTVIGDHNYLMAHSHVGHNAVLGNHIILANGALLSGHVIVGDRAFLSGNCVVHQFVRIGTLAIMQGLSAVSLDVPPFTVMRARNTISGLNTVGLRRAGFTSEQRLELKRLYHLLFRSRMKFSVAIAAARGEFTSETARVMLDFVTSSQRGICPDGSSKRAMVRDDGE